MAKPPLWISLAIAVLAVGAGALVRALFLRHLGTNLPYVTLFPAVVIASVAGGLIPGSIAVVLSIIISSYFMQNGGPWKVIPANLTSVTAFAGNGLFIALVLEYFHRARFRVEKARTREREANLAASASEGRFRVMADSAPVLIWMSDTTRACTWFNKPWLDFVGRKMGQELGDGWAQGVHPDDLSRRAKTYQQAFDARRPFEMDYRIRRHDGEYRWVADHGIPLFDSSGQFTGYIGSCLDITERKLAAQRLAENEERLRLGLAAGETGTWDWDMKRDHVEWSDLIYKFHGVTREAFGGKAEDFIKLVHPEDAPRVRSALQHSIENRADYVLEFRTVRPDGQTCWLATTGHVFFDSSNQPYRMLGATIDITQRKTAEQEREALLERERQARSDAEHASRMKDQFLATLSHELRTPLNAILGWSHVLKSSQRTEEDVTEGVAVIDRNARIQTRLIEDLLDMSRIISGKLRLDVQHVELPEVINAALESVRPSAEAKEIRIQKVLDPLAGPVKGDPARLQQIMWNLLSNAIKFTPLGGRVQVSLERINSHLEITIADDGVGIEPDFLPHIFERFRQADSTSTRKFGGLGLGLAITKNLVELHGGTIIAKSAGKDQGASFRINLPVPAAKNIQNGGGARYHPTAMPAESEPCLGIDFAQTAILVIDDEPDARELVKRILEDCKAKVTTAASAAEALEKLNNGEYAALVTDIGMPEMDGFELIKRIRDGAVLGREKIPAIALTAFARSEDRRRAMIAGFDMYVSKPVEPTELLAVVGRLTDKI